MWEKLGGSPVTEADMEVDLFLREGLLAARPAYGWLSEETADNPARRTCERIFIVDPIDGTRGFIAGDKRWCISMAVVTEGRPTTAVLFAPALGKMFWAEQGKGAFDAGGPLAVSSCASLTKARLAGARSWLRDAAFERYGIHIEAHMPSLAYRIACVADGSIDAAFASPRAHDWDLAASDLLVHEAGGTLSGLDGLAPRYNREGLTHGVLGAANGALQMELLAVLRGVAETRIPTDPLLEANRGQQTG